MAYTRAYATWLDYPATSTPITALALQTIENGISGLSVGTTTFDKIAMTSGTTSANGIIFGGVSGDTTLYRWAANQLATDGVLRVRSNSSAALVLEGASGGVTIGTDTNLYRATASVLQTDGSLVMGTGASATAGIQVRPDSVTDYIFRGLPGNNGPNNYFEIRGNGTHYWGAGAASAVDTNLYRASAAVLKTDGGFTAVGAIGATGAGAAFTVTQTAAGAGAVQLAVSGDTVNRLVITAAGVLNWGPGGASATDANLYRSALGVVKTDTQFIAGDGLTTKPVAGVVSDGSFAVTPTSGTLAVDTTNSKIYVRVGSTWKSVTVA